MILSIEGKWGWNGDQSGEGWEEEQKGRGKKEERDQEEEKQVKREVLCAA